MRQDGHRTSGNPLHAGRSTADMPWAGSFPQNIDYGGDVQVAVEGNCRTIHVQTPSGEGSMQVYEVFPGVTLAYNNFHMDCCNSGFAVNEDMLCIDHCFEGRLEQPVAGGVYSYVSAGDLKIDDRTHHAGQFVLPLGHYYGITVSFEVDRAQHSISRALGGFPVDLRRLRARFCESGYPLIMHDAPGAEHIFSELYSVPDEIRETYCKLKVLELLLFLQVLEPAGDTDPRPYFYRSHVERVKAARDLMVEDLTRDLTIDDLTERFDLPRTAFKQCFKGVYGMPPYTYIRAYRMEYAATLLSTTDLRVADIGLTVGYDSPSKFAAAFKEHTAQTPTAYRRTHRNRA